MASEAAIAYWAKAATQLVYLSEKGYNEVDDVEVRLKATRMDASSTDRVIRVTHNVQIAT